MIKQKALTEISGYLMNGSVFNDKHSNLLAGVVFNVKEVFLLFGGGVVVNLDLF